MVEQMHVDQLIDELIIRRRNLLSSKIKSSPRNNFSCSDIPDCDKYMVHTILDWEKRLPYNEYVQAMFDRGKEEERRVTIDLMDLGVEIVEGQKMFEIKHPKTGELICRGFIDNKIKFGGRKFPNEIKSMNADTFRGLKAKEICAGISIGDPESFSKIPYLRKYLRQMQMYLFGNNEEEGLFTISDLQGHYIFIPVYLDYGECELILKRLEKNWEFVKAKKYPAPMPFDEKICGRCPFKHICVQEVKREGAEFIDDPELEETLKRREELIPMKEEFSKLDKVRERFKDRDNEVFVGKDWRIFVKKSMRKTVIEEDMTPEDKQNYLTLESKYTKPKESREVKVIYLKDKEVE